MRIARTLLFSAGGLSVVLALMYLGGRGDTAEPALRASHDLVGLSMLFAGLVTISVAWLAPSAWLLAGYATLFGIYYAGHVWVLLFAGLGLPRAGAATLLAVASLAAAYLAWAERPTGGQR